MFLHGLLWTHLPVLLTVWKKFEGYFIFALHEESRRQNGDAGLFSSGYNYTTQIVF
jgi:hypothetical protein